MFENWLQRNQKTDKKPKRRIVIIVVSVALLLLVLAGGTVYMVFRHYYSLLDYQDADAVETTEGESGQQAEEPPTAQAVTDGSSALPMIIDPHDGNDSDAAPASDEEVASLNDQLIQNLERMEEESSLYTTDAFNVLLVGVDSREESFTGRSDSMILVSIDKKEKRLTMTSLLRDIYVSIPGHGSSRLNTAFARGGSSLLEETIEANFGIRADRCVVINFYLLMDLVDALGGMDLDVTADEIEVMNGYLEGQNKLLGNEAGTDLLSAEDAGEIHANGNQTLAYTRVRYVGTDFARTGRQRTVIQKCLDKLKDMELGEVMDLAEQFLPRIQTDLTEEDCASLLLALPGIPDYQIQTMTIPEEGTYRPVNIKGMSVLSIDFSENASDWHRLVEGEAEETSGDQDD